MMSQESGLSLIKLIAICSDLALIWICLTSIGDIYIDCVTWKVWMEYYSSSFSGRLLIVEMDLCLLRDAYTDKMKGL